MKKSLPFYLMIAITLSAHVSLANNVSVSNVTLTGQNTTDDYSMVKFDLSWDNSFRDVVNWDACWVLVKYRVNGDVWHHATLNTLGHTVPSGSIIDTPSDGKGTFIYRSVNGLGTFSLTGVQLRWNYGTDGVEDYHTVTVKVIAIEMVYVPTGNFELGDGDGTSENINSFHNGTTDNNVTINTSLTSDIRVDVNTNDDDQIELTGIGVDGDDGIDTDDDGSIDNANFPTGYIAFYCMKYEITQEQYVDFLNVLTYTQQVTRTAVVPNSTAGTGAMTTTTVYRNGIEIQISGVASTTPAVYACDLTDDGIYDQNNDGQNVASNWISYADGMAYADWAGLRPMTELEYEKTCRGVNQPATVWEFAWGTDQVTHSVYTLSNSGEPNESISVNYSTTQGNCFYRTTEGDITEGPLRVGIFASHASNTGRITAGAAYYGIMEMSGNVYERCITIGNSTGRAFSGNNGDGVLASDGNSNTNTWPGTDAIGTGPRGGSWDSSSLRQCISNRSYASYPSWWRGDNFGFRCVRYVP